MNRNRIRISLVGFALMAGCGNSASEKLLTAETMLRRQVASDIDVTIDRSSLRINEPAGDFYFVCGTATLNRPNAGRLTLDNAVQRFITTVNRSGAGGITLFDGSSSLEGKEKFQSEWVAKCSA